MDSNTQEVDAILADVLAGTVLDASRMGRYIPAQFWEEYTNQRNTIKRIVSTARQLTLVVPLCQSEREVPVVSLIVWAKVGHILKVTRNICHQRVIVLGSSRLTTDHIADSFGRVFRIMEVLGVIPEIVSGMTVREKVDQDGIVGPAVAAYMQSLIDQGKLSAASPGVERMLDAASQVAFCLSDEGSFLCCGQDQAPLANALAEGIASKAEGMRRGSIGLYMPALPFRGAQHLFVDDSKDMLGTKVRAVLQSLSSLRSQREFAVDLVELTAGRSGHCNTNEVVDQIGEGFSLHDISFPCIDCLHRWLTVIRNDEEGMSG
jgi:hypothetical protein